jgi:hypothetical protein
LSVLLHEIQHGLQNIEGFANGGSPLGFYDPEKSAAAIAYMQGLHEQNPDVGWDQGVERRRREDARKIPLQAGATEADKFEAYRRLAGEVEARNTQARQGMTDAERRLRPPSTTADVPDQDLIQITGGVVIGDVVLQAVYHGTPHHFDRFSINKIGTGEPSQLCTKLPQT